jgi:ectoine hydroxylase-related dioxygenase (phytanoyl-CoA dioxygenase family)
MKHTANWRAQVFEEGYGIVPEAVGRPTIEELRSVFQEGEFKRSRAGIRHLMAHGCVADIASSKGLLAIAKQILGETAVPFRATLFDKSGSSNWLVAWHQDTALPLSERREADGWGPWSVKEGIVYAHAPAQALERVLAVRLHLDDSDMDNGPLRVLPKTQCMGVLTDEEVHGLSEKIQAVDCPVGAGGIVLMRPLVVHASSKALSEKPRRVLHIEYAEGREMFDDVQLAMA